MSDATSDAPVWSTLTFLAPLAAYVAMEGECADIAPDGVQVDDSSTLTGKDLPPGVARATLYVPKLDLARAERQLQALAGRHNLSLEVQSADLEERDWNATWKAHYKPLTIGRRIRVEPVFAQLPPEEGILRVIIDPGMAFGTGTHETTQLAAEVLEGWLDAALASGADLSALRLLDVGTGSGILSIAALKLGIGHAVGTEVDEPGLENTADNAALNEVSERFEVIATGSPASVSGGPFPLVLANIISGILLQIRDELVSQVAPGGTLVLSGVLTRESDEFLEQFAVPGLTLQESRSRGEWAAFVWRKEG